MYKYLNKKNDGEIAMAILNLHLMLLNKKYQNELEKEKIEGMYNALKWATGTLENQEEMMKINAEFKTSI